MLTIPKRVSDRFSQNLRRIQATVQSCRDRDINESDTVTLVIDILCDLLGYDKYGEITKEHAIRGTYCDIAIRSGSRIQYLIECKAIGIALKDAHIQQALNYAANQGCEWVFLTNGALWKVYRVVFGQPIGSELIFDLDISTLSVKDQASAEMLFALSREGIDRNGLTDYYHDQQAKDRYSIAALLQTDTILKVLRRELKALSPGVSIETGEILKVLQEQVIKRDLLEGDRAAEADKRVRKAMRKREAQKPEKAPMVQTNEPEPEAIEHGVE